MRKSQVNNDNIYVKWAIAMKKKCKPFCNGMQVQVTDQMHDESAIQISCQMCALQCDWEINNAYTEKKIIQAKYTLIRFAMWND